MVPWLLLFSHNRKGSSYWQSIWLPYTLMTMPSPSSMRSAAISSWEPMNSRWNEGITVRYSSDFYLAQIFNGWHETTIAHASGRWSEVEARVHRENLYLFLHTDNTFAKRFPCHKCCLNIIDEESVSYWGQSDHWEVMSGKNARPPGFEFWIFLTMGASKS